MHARYGGEEIKSGNVLLPSETRTMTDPVLFKIAWVIGAVIAYGLLRLGMMKATHEFRIRVGCEADRWAEDPRVDPRVRASLTGVADMAYRPATPWLVLSGLTVAVLLPLHKLPDVRVSDDAEVVAEVVRIKLKLLLALIATSPLACVLAVAVLMIGLLVRRSVSAIRDSISAAGDRFFPDTGAGYSHSV